jgi:hypothetical protein
MWCCNSGLRVVEVTVGPLLGQKLSLLSLVMWQ